MKYLTTLLHGGHERNQFESEHESLNRYLRTQAGQDVKRKLSVCFVMADESNCVKGYYTLSNDAIEADALPENILKKLRPPYDRLPVTLLGRLAVDKTMTGKGFGKKLLIDALRRSYEASWSIGSLAVVVDTVNDPARSFYRKYGFIDLPDGAKMFLPMKTIAQLFE
jgi:GNAT superfamily N-acetyltransferase